MGSSMVFTPPSATVRVVPFSYSRTRTRLRSCSDGAVDFHRLLGYPTSRTSIFCRFSMSSTLPLISASLTSSARVLDANSVAKLIMEEITADVSKFKDAVGVVPCLASILVGVEDPNNNSAAIKRRACDSVGIKYFELNLPQHSSEQQVLNYISNYNQDPSIHGILVHLPLPNHLKNNVNILRGVNIDKDVDGLHPLNMGMLMRGGDPFFVPCTPKGFLQLLHIYNISIKEKNVIIIHSPDKNNYFVASITAFLLQREGAAVFVAPSRAKDLEQLTKEADIVISAVAHTKMVRGGWIKPGAVVIDIGINPVEYARGPSGGQLVGDVCFEEAFTSAPSGGVVGPLTIPMLLSNTLMAAKRMHSIMSDDSQSL